PVPLRPVDGFPVLLGESLLARLLWALRRPGLAPRRRSRVRPRRTSKRDVGAPLISFNALIVHRSTPPRWHWPWYVACAGCDVGVRCHADGRYFSSSGDWSSSSSAFAISHGSRGRLSPAPGPDRHFAGMRLSRSPHGSGLAIGPRNLPSSSSQLRRGYDKAPRGAIPVVVQKLFAAGLDEAVVGVPTGHLPAWHVRHERAALFQAGQHARHALVSGQAPIVGLDQFLFLDAAGGRQDRDAALLGDPPHPGLVASGALLEHGRLDRVDADHVVKEVDQVLGTLEPLKVAT